MRKTTTPLFLMLSVVSLTMAQAPDWTVNSNNFENSMSIVAVAEIESTELSSTSSMIGAFVGSELRGVAATSFVNADNRHVAHILVWSNIGGGETVTFQVYDASANAVVQSVNTIAFQNDAAEGNTSAPYIVRDNNPPTGIDLSASAIDENSSVDAEVGQFSSTDIDAGDTHTYSLVTGAGDGDNAQFSIDQDKLLLASIPDFEEDNSLSVRVRTTDSKNGVFERVFSITILDVNDTPTDISLSATAINENNAVGDAIGALSTEDQDASDAFGYALVTGDGDTDNGVFRISGNQLVANAPFNFEEQGSLNIRLQSTDTGNETFEKQFTITINDVNDRPTEIVMSETQIAENQEVVVLVGMITSTDDDVSDEHIYSFTGSGNNDNESFVIVENQLFTKAVFDFEDRVAYFVHIQTDDQRGGLYSEVIELNITNTNDPPTGLSMSTQRVGENLPEDTMVGTFETTDQDTNDSFTYELIAGEDDTDNAGFTIDGNELLLASTPDFEATSSLNIRVKTVDAQGATFEQSFVIEVEDANDAPTGIEVSTNKIAENNDVGQAVGLLTTLDQDAEDSYTYSLISGAGDADNATFDIVGNQLVAQLAFDFETRTSYSVRIATTDSGNETAEEIFAIEVGDANDFPNAISLDNTNIVENQATGALVGTLTTTDQDIDDEHIYTFLSTGSNDNEDFTIIGNQLFTKSVFDFEEQVTYFVSIQTDDQNGGTFDRVIELSITDANDAPTAISMSDQLVAENVPLGTVIGEFETEDQDSNDRFTYRLVSGTGDEDNDLFDIVGDELRTDDLLNFEQRSNYTIRISSRDTGGRTIESTFAINVEDQNDDPTDIILDNNTTLENLSPGIIVGSLTTLDEDEADDHFYVLSEGDGADDNEAFAISDGRLITNTTFDFETKSSFTVRVETNDRKDGMFQKSFSIEIRDTNDDPTLLQLSPRTVQENLDAGAKVGTLIIEDQDPDGPSFSLIPGTNDNNLFKIDGSDLLTTEIFDYEVDAQYFIDMLGNDGSGGLVVNRFEITVEDTKDAPIALELSLSTVMENSPLGTIVGQLSTQDQDAEDSHTYELIAGEGDADNASFRIVGNELLTDDSFNFELRSSYQIRIQSSDASDASTEAQFSIEVTDANDAPTDIILSQNQIDEELPIGSLIGELTIADEDVDDVFNIRLVGGTGGEDSGDFLIEGNQLLTNAVFDAETRVNYAIRINATDVDGASISDNFIISVLPINEPPQLEAQEFTVPERSAIGTSVGVMVASDIDGDVLTFALENVEAPFTIEETSGMLTVSSDDLDYETSTLYELDVVVTDPGGLSSRSVAIVFIEDVVEQEEGLPVNDFVSPNNDGFNDFLEIQNIELYRDYTLLIFNNAGVEVYRSSAYQNTWNGVDNSGSELTKGSYYFTFISPASPVNFKGSITLVR